MKIDISNWGPIEKCEYNMDKNLIVTYGKNNIGKSYAMMVLYLLLKKFKETGHYWGQPFFADNNIDDSRSQKLAEKIMQFTQNQEEKEWDITHIIVDDISSQISSFLIPELEKSFDVTFGTYRSIVEKKPQIIFEINGATYQIDMAGQRINVNWDVKTVKLARSSSDFHKTRELKNKIYFYVYQNKISNAISAILEKENDMCRQLATEFYSKVRDVVFLPASRSGIYAGMSSFGPILASLSQNRFSFRQSVEIPSLSEPIADYYMALSNIRSDNTSSLNNIASRIEKEILGGDVLFDDERKTLLYRAMDSDMQLTMSDVSSMVSEISPITAYLKYIIGKNEMGWWRKPNENASTIVFIEEPEAHLHPSVQVKLVEIFAELIQHKVKLVMSSHSNYIFNKLNNLVIAGQITEEQYEPTLMVKENNRSVTNKVTMDLFGADDMNFADVAEQLLEEREELIENLLAGMED